MTEVMDVYLGRKVSRLEDEEFGDETRGLQGCSRSIQGVRSKVKDYRSWRKETTESRPPNIGRT